MPKVFHLIEEIWIFIPDNCRCYANNLEVPLNRLTDQSVVGELLLVEARDVFNDELAMGLDVLKCLVPSRRIHR